MRILANDGLNKEYIDGLITLGFEVVNIHYDKEELKEKLKVFDAIVIRSATKLDREVLEAVKDSDLKLIIRAGVGVDNIDVRYAKEIGITVRNTPNASSDSVAELAIAHIFAVARFLGDSNYTMRNGKWNKKIYEGTEISGKTLGIIGMGRIGKSLANKASSLGMNIIYYTIEGKYEELEYDFLSIDEVLENADFISLHVPYDKKVGSLIGEKEIDKMKDGAYIINCSRGKVVEEQALINALNSGKLAGAGIDVFEEEPTSNEELLNNPKVSVTPHIGASTKEAQERIGEEIVDIIKEFEKLALRM